MDEQPGAPLPDDADEPPIVKLLEGLDDQTERLRTAIRHVRRLWMALAVVMIGVVVLGIAHKVQIDRLHDLVTRTNEIATQTNTVTIENRTLVRKVAALTLTTTRSLCELRHDLERRVADSERFRREHPEGIPGIPAATLRQSEAGQRRTIVALGGLKCRVAQAAPPTIGHPNP